MHTHSATLQSLKHKMEEKASENEFSLPSALHHVWKKRSQ